MQLAQSRSGSSATNIPKSASESVCGRGGREESGKVEGRARQIRNAACHGRKMDSREGPRVEISEDDRERNERISGLMEDRRLEDGRREDNR